MDLIRFILPFLFTRNWYDGSWELSRPRLYVFLGGIFLVVIGILAAYTLQSPIVYHA